MRAFRICFVCMGNICRSPTAEAVMRELAHRAGVVVELDSAGTGGWHAGEPSDPRTRQAGAARGYVMNHRARQFTAADFARFDLVVAMDADNLAHLQQLAAGREAPPIRLLREFEPGTPDHPEVPDPYYGSGDGFERVLDICERACGGLVDYVRDHAARRRA